MTRNTPRGRAATLALMLVATGLAASAQAQPSPAAHAAPRSNRDETVERQMKIMEPFSVAAVGDIIEPQPINIREPGFVQLADRMRGADIGFANMESSLVDFRHFEGAVFGTEAPLDTARAMRDMGITLVNHANNHTFDGGLPGMISTDEALDRAGIVHAGTGRNLQEARAAQVLNTPKGRVGLVGMYSVDDVSSYGPAYARTEATARNGNLGGGAGLDPLHLTTYHIVSPEQLQALRQIASAAYGGGAKKAEPASGPDRVKFFDEWYQAGADVGALHYAINKKDEDEILQSIRNGKVYSDFLIATVHAHQAATFAAQGVGGVEHQPADFLIQMAHDSIDNGADMFIVHGMHSLHGIEVYKGKPVFYGLSNFIFQFGIQLGRGSDIMANEKAMSSFESEDSQHSILTTTRFEHGKLAEIRLYPVDLGGSRRPISQMGIPTAANPKLAQQILADLQDYSSAFGTKIEIKDGVGIIRLPA